MNIRGDETIEKLEVLPQDFTQEVGEIAPIHKVEGRFVSRECTDLLERMSA